MIIGINITIIIIYLLLFFYLHHEIFSPSHVYVSDIDFLHQLERKNRL